MIAMDERAKSGDLPTKLMLFWEPRSVKKRNAFIVADF
jgi:hypothetical protein